MAAAAWDDVKAGEFVRRDASYRHQISADGEFKPESGRYVLYGSYACPWVSRTLAVRTLKGLEDHIPVVIVNPVMERTRPNDPDDSHTGWVFATESSAEHGDVDSYNGCKSIRDLYLVGDPQYDGRFTVPVFWDTKTKRIVNNESSEICVFLNDQFNSLAKYPDVDLYPAAQREEIDAINKWTYGINNGVYKSGFATTQDAYNKAVEELFQLLDRAEDLLSKQRYLAGANLTLADLRLFVTLVRFDEVYHGHFKCNKRMLMQYENLFNYTKDVYQYGDGRVSRTVNMYHIKEHYHRSHKTINLYGIVPIGPNVDFNSPHNRAERFP